MIEYKKKTERILSFSGKLLMYVIIYGIAFTILYPFLFMSVSAFRGREDMFNPAVVWVTRHFTWEHIGFVINFMDYPTIIGHTVSIALVSALLQTLVCSFVGYGFARFKFPGKGVFFAVVIFTIIIPAQTYITPTYLLFRNFQIPVISQVMNLIKSGSGSWSLINNPVSFWLQALTGMGIRSGLFIYIFRQFYRGMPKELESAALIDGSGAYRTYFKVMMPNAVPAMVSVFMFSLVWHWNDYFITSVLSTNSKTMAIALSELRYAVSVIQGPDGANVLLQQIRVQAGALIAVIPMLVLFVISQKFFIESVERTGITG